MFGFSNARRLLWALLAAIMLFGCRPQWQLEACPPADPPSVTSPILSGTAFAPPAPSAMPALPSPTPVPFRLQPGDLLLAASEDDIPALNVEETHFVSAQAAVGEWELEELVIGLEVAGQARAYPVRLLSLHEIVNDEINGVPVAVTWCPLCYSPIAFDRRVDGQTLSFGVSGYLLNSNLVMVDRQTGTLWSQLLGQGIRGAYRNEWLKVVPARLLKWKSWQELHPDSMVLSARALGMDPARLVDPYSGYYFSGAPGLSGQGDLDGRLTPKALVMGISLGEAAKAYPVAYVIEQGVVNDRFAGVEMVLVYDLDLVSIQVFRAAIQGRPLTFDPLISGFMVDRQTGSKWRLRDGVAIEGPMKGERLVEIPSTTAFWFAWSEFREDTQLFGVGSEE